MRRPGFKTVLHFTMGFLRLASITLAVLSTCGFAIDGQQAFDSDAKPIFWPETQRPKTIAKPTNILFDGSPVSILSLQTGQVSLEIVKREPFSLVPESSSRYSTEIVNRNWPNVYLGLSFFDKSEFLPDLSENSWLAYKAGLALQRPDAQVVFESSNIDSPATPYVLGAKFRQIAYEIQSGPEIAKKREIFAFVGGDLLVFSVTGLKADVDNSWAGVDQFINEMNLSR